MVLPPPIKPNVDIGYLVVEKQSYFFKYPEDRSEDLSPNFEHL